MLELARLAARWARLRAPPIPAATPGRARTAAHDQAFGLDHAEGASEADDDTGHAAVAHQQVRAEPDDGERHVLR